MGCTEYKSDDEGYNNEERRQHRRILGSQNYQEDEESNLEEDEFKDFEEVGSKLNNK